MSKRRIDIRYDSTKHYDDMRNMGDRDDETTKRYDTTVGFQYKLDHRYNGALSESKKLPHHIQ